MSSPEEEDYESSRHKELTRLHNIVLNSQEYIDECAPLQELYFKSREVAEDPVKTLEIQEELFNHRLRYESAKRSAGDALNKELYNQLIVVNATIGDSVAWRTLGYDRFVTELLITHNQTGGLNALSGPTELQVARRIVEDEGSFVILNDLTNCLRFGDITVVSKNGIRLEEVKQSQVESGKKAKGSRNIQQKNELANLNNVFATKAANFDFGGFNHWVMTVNKPVPLTYHSQFDETIQRARNVGYALTAITPYFILEIFDQSVPPSEEIMSGIKRPFGDQIENCVSFSNAVVHNDYKGLGSSAPYGIFPLSNQDCFDLMSQRLVVRTTVHLGGIAALYDQVGVDIMRKDRIEHDRKRLTKAIYKNPTGSKEQNDLEKEGVFDYYLVDREDAMKVKATQSYFSDLVIDLFDARSFVLFDKFRREQVKKLAEEGKFIFGSSNLHLRMNESQIWR